MLNLTSLREQVYRYLRREMQEGKLLPGSSINIGELSRELGISKTPLRDALIHLEAQGFVTILPRRGVVVNTLSLEEVRHLIQIVGALEASAIESAYERLSDKDLARLTTLNRRMVEAVGKEDFNTYYRLNKEFHGMFIERCQNPMLTQTVIPLKQRLYDFPRLAYIQEWELINCGEHQQIIERLAARDPAGAALIMRDAHWSFSKHEGYIRQFYANVTREIAAELGQQAARATSHKEPKTKQSHRAAEHRKVSRIR